MIPTFPLAPLWLTHILYRWDFAERAKSKVLKSSGRAGQLIQSLLSRTWAHINPSLELGARNLQSKQRSPGKTSNRNMLVFPIWETSGIVTQPVTGTILGRIWYRRRLIQERRTLCRMTQS